MAFDFISAQMAILQSVTALIGTGEIPHLVENDNIKCLPLTSIHNFDEEFNGFAEVTLYLQILKTWKIDNPWV